MRNVERMCKKCALLLFFVCFGKIQFNWSSNRCFDNFEEMLKSLRCHLKGSYALSYLIAVAGDDTITISMPWACRKKLYFWQPFLGK